MNQSAAMTPSAMLSRSQPPLTPSFAASEQISDSTKLQIACTWLKEVLGKDGDVPPFEINSQTVDVLFGLALFNKQREVDVQLLIEDAHEKAAHYKQEADKMENIMSTIGLSIDRLPPAGVTSLASLASLALTLDTKDTSLASYYLSLQDLDEELHDVSKKREEQQASLSGLLEKTRLAVARLDKMSKTLLEYQGESDQQKQAMNERMSEVRYLQGKTAECHATMQKLKEEISASGVSNEITHSALVKLNKEWKVVHEKTEPLLESLKKYHQLPPDATLAKIKIDDARREVARLNQQISDTLARMNISYH